MEAGIDDAHLDETHAVAEVPVDGRIHEGGALEGGQWLAAAGSGAASSVHSSDGAALDRRLLDEAGLRRFGLELTILLLGGRAGVVKRHLVDFSDLDHSTGSVRALASDNGDSRGAFDGFGVAFFLILEVVFSDLFGSGHRGVDSDIVRFVYHLFNFAGNLDALGNHGGHGYLFGNSACGIFNRCGAAARVLANAGDIAAATVDSGFGSSDYSNLF